VTAGLVLGTPWVVRAVLCGIAFAALRCLVREARHRRCTTLALVGTWPSRGCADGALQGGEDGELVELFDPPWWRVGRWWTWRFAEGRRRTSAYAFRGDEVVEVRAMSVRYVPRSPTRWYVDD